MNLYKDSITDLLSLVDNLLDPPLSKEEIEPKDNCEHCMGEGKIKDQNCNECKGKGYISIL